MEQRVRFELTVLRICNPLRWASPPPLHNLAYLQGLEPRRTVLETVMLPLHQRYIIWWILMESNHLPATPLINGYRVTAGNGGQDPNTLFPMCILKHTVCGITAHVNSIHFNITSIFFSQERKPSTSPPVYSVFKVRCQDLVSCIFTLCDSSDILGHLSLY